MSYSTSHGYNQSYPPFSTLNQKSPSWIPQEHLGYPSSVQPHYTRPVAPPGFHGGIGELGGRYEGDSHHELGHHDAIRYTCHMYGHLSRLQGATPSCSNGLNTESKIKLHAPGIVDNHVARIHSDHPLHTLSDYETHHFYNYASYFPGEHTTGGGVDVYGNFDENKVNSEGVEGLPPNQLPFSPGKLHPHGCLSPIVDRSVSKTSRGACRSATDAQSRLSTKPRKSTPCGWRDDTGSECGEPINCSNFKDHFSTVHRIKNMAEHVKIICRWCRSQRAVMRKNFPRHLKEVHLGSARSKKAN